MTEVTLNDDAWKDVETGVEALLDKWLVSPGDSVHAGQALAQVVIVKSSQEIVAPCDGQVESVLVQAGDTFGRGQPVLRLKEVT